MDKKPKAWFLRKIFLIPTVTVLGLIGLASLGSDSTPTPVIENVQTVTSQTQQYTPPSQVTEKQTVQKTPTSDSGLSNNNYYENVDGNQIHSPAYSDSVPAGASAQCRDGTYSFSQNRRGTCSHHGGVANWL